LFTLLGFPLLFTQLALLYAAPMALYLTLALLCSLKMAGIRESVLTFAGVVATHYTYGAFFLRGLCTRRLQTHKTVPFAILPDAAQPAEVVPGR
jgi:hypothetical protein